MANLDSVWPAPADGRRLQSDIRNRRAVTDILQGDKRGQASKTPMGMSGCRPRSRFCGRRDKPGALH